MTRKPSRKQDRSTSKFDSDVAERAYGIANDGMADAECGSSVDGGGWYALVTVDGRHVIIREDSQGFVWVDDAETHHTEDHDRIVRYWDSILAFTNDIER